MQPLASTPSRTELVYQTIRDSIRDCRLEPGRHLVQEELAAMLGVSRQPIQQAMLLLKTDGLVVESGARGLYVAPLDPEAIGHHYQIRLVFDQLAAELVAARAAGSADFARELRRRGESILDEGEQARSVSAAEAVSHDVRFHTFLYEMSGNPLIAPAADMHWNFLRRVMVAVLLHAERGPVVWMQHRDILESLIAGQGGEARERVTAHILGAKEALFAALAERAKAGAGKE
ncbi:MAG: GntR family transcriptional regulator [Rhodobacteraceae bacterium]|nr:GntR family transcriptional regulator [Paracoccaceae bacterium]